MKCLFIGGPIAGQVREIENDRKFVELAILRPDGYGAYVYRVRQLSDGFNMPHTICVSDDIDPLNHLMKFYEDHAKGESA